MTRLLWRLDGFMPAMKAWSEFDPPSGDLLVLVAEFGAELERDPEKDAEREHQPVFFFRIMPGTEHDGRIVSVTFTLGRAMDPGYAGEVRCQHIVCVPHPPQLPLGSSPGPHHR